MGAGLVGPRHHATEPFSRRWLGQAPGHAAVLGWSTLAVLPLLLLALWQDGAEAVLRLVLATAVALAWQAGFARLRGRALQLDGWLTAGGLLILLGPDLPLAQLLITTSFAIVFGEQLFGGRGRYLVNPVVLGLAFQAYAFGPQAATPIAGLGLVAAFGALLLVLQGLISWRVLLAAALGVGLVFLYQGDWRWPALHDPIWFALLFLLTDPVAAAVTPLGRGWDGALAGVLLAWHLPPTGEPSSLPAVAFALLLASLFAPLIDRVVMVVLVFRRRRRTAHV